VKGPVTPAGHDLQRRDDGRWGSNACQNQEESDLAICLEFGLLASVWVQRSHGCARDVWWSCGAGVTRQWRLPARWRSTPLGRAL